MKLLVINNLASGYGEGAIYDFMRSFAADGDDICMRCTNGTTPISTLLDDAKDFDAVIAAGGDGTVATVCYLLANTGIPVLPFPAGTANLLALNLASPLEPHALAKMVRTGQTLDFDTGEICVDGKRFGFSIMAGAGYDAVIMRGAQRGKRLFGPMAYLQSAVANAMPQQSKFTLTLDGRQVESEGLGVLLVNFSKIQFDITVTHDNKPRDGEFDVVVLKAKTAFDLIPAAIAGLWIETANSPTARMRSSSSAPRRSRSKPTRPWKSNTTARPPAFPRRFPRGSCPGPRACSSPMKATRSSRNSSAARRMRPCRFDPAGPHPFGLTTRNRHTDAIPRKSPSPAHGGRRAFKLALTLSG